jgi:membrane protein DedA with SNARE-associated domain
MDYFMAHAIALVRAHPDWAFLVIGITAFGESFVFLSLFFPGTAILIAAGTLVSEGVLSPLPAILAGIIGAVLGDSISFWIGKKFRPALPALWPFRDHPERIARGLRFFARFGGSSVFIGRFFGPLRAIVPLAAGMMRMPSSRFYVANVLSAVIWAPALVLFGDQLARLIGQESLATKLVYVALLVVALTVVAAWIRRRFLST